THFSRNTGIIREIRGKMRGYSPQSRLGGGESGVLVGGFPEIIANRWFALKFFNHQGVADFHRFPQLPHTPLSASLFHVFLVWIVGMCLDSRTKAQTGPRDVCHPADFISAPATLAQSV